MFQSRFLGIHTGCCHTVLQGIHFVALFIGIPHGGFDAAIGEKATEHDVFDARLPQEKFQVCTHKATQAALALDCQITRLWLHETANFRAPLAIGKSGTFGHTSQNTVRATRDLLVALQKRKVNEIEKVFDS